MAEYRFRAYTRNILSDTLQPMRRYLALLVLLIATVHPLAHQHSLGLPGPATIVDHHRVEDCPCTHAVVIDASAPRVVHILPRGNDHAVRPQQSFVPASIVGEVPSRAPPAAA